MERRRARQEAREREARAQREAKELEGCTFAPKLMTKKRKRNPNMPPTPNVGQGNPSMFGQTEGQLGVVTLDLGGGADMEGRDLGTFLLDQKRYEEERK